MVVGDSIGVNLAGGLSAVKDEYQIDLLNYAFDGCAAVVDGTYRWPDGSLHTVSASCRQRVSEWSGQIASFDPDVVLVHSSIFDILDRKASGWADYKTIGDPVFDSWLQGQQRSVAAKLAAGGARVVWSTTPCAKFNPSRPNHHEDGEGNRRIDLLDGLIRRIGVSVAEFDSKVCPGGTFSSTVFGVPNARPDGVHFTPAAAQAIADQWLAPYLLSLRP